MELFRRKKKKQDKKQKDKRKKPAKENTPDFSIYSCMEKTVSIIPGSSSGISAGVSSIMGTRQYQQDAADIVENQEGSILAVVCDGMGGMEAGEAASKLCVETLCQDFLEYKQTEYAKFLCREVQNLDRRAANLKNKEGQLLRTGTTLVSTIISGNHLYWISVGDSRIYIIRENKMVCATTDHNYSLILKEQVEAHQITEKEAEAYQGKEALISYIGLGRVSRVDVNEVPFILEDGDCILLCSDGLYKTMSEEMILDTVKLYAGNMDEAAEILTAAAACLGEQRQDNTTVIIMKYRE